MKRAKRVDRLYALHEAAHAVTAEALSPGCSAEIEMDYVPGTETFFGVVYGDNTEAVYSWFNPMNNDDTITITFASKYGERFSKYQSEINTCHGDNNFIRNISKDRLRNLRLSLRARKIVNQNREKIERLADALVKKRYMTGDEIRKIIA